MYGILMWSRRKRELIKNPFCHLKFAFVPDDVKQGGQLYVQQITGAKWEPSHRPGSVSVAVKSKEQQPPSFVYSCTLPHATVPCLFGCFFSFKKHINVCQ